MLPTNNSDEKKFDIVKSEFDAYKRWGYATDYSSGEHVNQEPVEIKDEKEIERKQPQIPQQ